MLVKVSSPYSGFRFSCSLASSLFKEKFLHNFLSSFHRVALIQENGS